MIKVTDFGIAKASNSATITNSSKVMGSAHYFSPEQAKGSVVDARTDIYSLGIVMYEMITGKVPFDAESPVSVALKHIQESVIPPNQINKDIPESLNKVVLKCLEKQPIKRYQSIKDLLDDLLKIQNNEDILTDDNLSENDMTRVMDTAIINDKLKESLYNEDEEGDDDEDSEEDEDKSVGVLNKRSSGRKINKKLIGGAIAVLIVVIGAVSAFLAHGKLGGSEVVVPNIVGMSKEQAEKVLKDKKLKLTVAQKVKSDKEEGTIVECYPPVGTKVKINSEVRVSISGGNILTVPNLKSMDLDTAKKIISDSKLKLASIDYQYNDYVARGNVISQTPDPDSEVKEGTEIKLVISKGPEVKYVKVPSVVGRSLGEAQGALSNAGLSLGGAKAIYTEDQSQDGKVASQSIGASERDRKSVV